MIKALYEGKVIAESNNTIFLEGNHYFPETDVKKEFLVPNDYHTTCPWKGLASYYDIQGEDLSENAAWYYSEPKEKAQEIKGHLAFDKRFVTIEE